MGKNNLAMAASLRDSISFSVKITNTGNYNGDEVMQVYMQYPAIERMPIKELKAFKRVYLPKDGSSGVNFSIPAVNYKNGTCKKRNGNCTMEIIR